MAWTPPDARERFGQLVAESQKADDALHPLRLAARGLPPSGAVFVDLQSEAFARQLATNKRAELSGLAGIDGAKVALLHEVLDKAALQDMARIAAALKRLPLRLLRPRPVAETISSAGGVRLQALDEALMLRDLPGVFCAGEMLDWEAPTGGYLLTACFASGLRAGKGASRWLKSRG